MKPQTRVNDGLSSTVPTVSVVDGLLSPQSSASSTTVLTSSELSSTFPHLTTEPNDDSTVAGRGRRNTYRATRRRREDDRTIRPAPLTEVKVSPPKFDLAPSNFPPLPGCSGSPQGEPVLENRMSDVVRGLNRDKQSDSNKESTVSTAAPASEETAPRSALTASKPTVHTAEPAGCSVSATPQEKKLDKSESLAHKDVPVNPNTPSAIPQSPAQPAPISKTPLSPTNPATPQANSGHPSPAPLEPRKLSYAEVCQRPPKDPPPPPPPPVASPSPASSTSQPLRELRVNKVDEQSGGNERPERPQDRGGDCKSREGRSGRDSQGFYRSNGPPRTSTGGFKLREQQRRPQFTRRTSPQGASRHTGKEQNIPPISPK